MTFKVVNLRWGILLLFFVGYVLTQSHFQFRAGDYFIYNSLACVTCAVLLTQLKAFEQRYAAVWLVFALLITVYFLRFYWIAIDPLPVEKMLPPKHYQNMVRNTDQLFYAFKLSVLIFSIFSLASAVILFFMKNQNIPVHHKCFHGNKDFQWFISRLSLAVLVPLILVMSYFSYRYHIGEMGVDSGDALPFRLKGIIFYARIVFVPLLIILLIYSAERSGRHLMSRVGIVLMMTHGVIDMLLRNSRSSMLLSILLLIFLVLIGGIRLHRNEKILIGITIALAFIMVPIMTAYRGQRADGLLMFESLNNAISVEGHNWWKSLSVGIKFVFFRMPGLEALWCMLANGAQPLGSKSREALQSINGIAGHLSYNIYFTKFENNSLSAPSYLGWFYLVGGLPAIVFGGFIASVVSAFGWRFLGRNYLECAPVAQVFLLWMLFVALTEGTLDTMVYMVLAGVAFLLGIEFGLRFIKSVYVRQRSLKNLI
jgi:hypothetical protein